jgi:hypothetical protein
MVLNGWKRKILVVLKTAGRHKDYKIDLGDTNSSKKPTDQSSTSIKRWAKNLWTK